MGDIDEKLNEAVEKATESKLNTFVAAAVAVTATFMALCNVKDGNIVQTMQQEMTRAVDSWSYYQAKSTKQNLVESQRDSLQLDRDLSPNLSPETRALYDKKIIEYDARSKRYEEDKAKIKAEAEEHEAKVEALNVHDDQFDIAEAAISIGIAMYGVTALTQKKWLFVVASVFAGFGTLMGIAGFAGWTIHPDWLAKVLS